MRRASEFSLVLLWRIISLHIVDCSGYLKSILDTLGHEVAARDYLTQVLCALSIRPKTSVWSGKHPPATAARA
jgi:hypothetical protein